MSRPRRTVYLAQSVPRPMEGRIADLAGYRLGRSAGLASAISDFEARIDAPVYVVTLPSIGLPKSGVKPFATQLFNEWRIGSSGTQRGVLVLIVKDVRRIEIEVGNRLNGVVSHTWTPRMLERDVTPLLKEGEYAKGVEKVVQRLAARIENGGSAGLPKDWYCSPTFWMSKGKTGEAEDALQALAVGAGASAVAATLGVSEYARNRRERTCDSCGSVVTQGVVQGEASMSALELQQRLERDGGYPSHTLRNLGGPQGLGQPAATKENRIGAWHTTMPATHSRAGRRQRILHCHKCGAVSTKVQVIPRLVEREYTARSGYGGGGWYSSDGGYSDDGGCSDGGGGGGGDF